MPDASHRIGPTASAVALAVCAAACASGRGGLIEGLGTTAPPAPDATMKERLATLLARAAEGQPDASAHALREATTYARSHPGPLADAYLGAATLLVARDSNPLNRIGALREGVDLLDRAVLAAPRSVEARYLRATATFPLPGLLGRAQTARDDLEWLVAALDGPTVVGTEPQGFLTPRRRAMVLLQLGVRRGEAGDRATSRSLFERAVAEAPDSPPGRRAQIELDADAEDGR